jgi:two-component system, chemotaxis family, sensor kinase Cph1
MHLKAQKALPGSHVICDSICHSNQQLNNHSQANFGGQLKEFFLGIFDTSYWPPRWYCGTWTDFHGWLYIFSDLFIWAAYFAIPFLLFRIINKRKDIPFPRIIWLFIAFILLCGTTHLIDAVIFWWPAYRLSALIRFITAVVSIFTVYALYKILPMVYNLRTLGQLEVEIEKRKKVEQVVKHHQVMQEAAEELMSRKDEFMSIASHELKTPITSLKASLQLVERMVDKDELLLPVAPLVEKAVKQVNKLTDIVNELMDVTRIQAGRLELSKTDFILMDMIEECQEQCIAENNNRVVNLMGNPDLIIRADRNRLEQVVSNLLTNAFKYSPDNDSVLIKFEKTDNNKIRVEVTDNGIGIPEDKISNIFDRFYRVESTSKNFSGIGLGLYISSEIIKRHQGEIGVESTLGKGSTFWFII